MAVQVYRITCKSAEQRGASSPNIIELGFSGDADAETFGTNIQLVLGGTVVSVDKVVTEDYSLPYPSGTDKMVRCAAYDGVSRWQNFRIYDIKSSFDVDTRAAALISAGYEMWLPERGVFLSPALINIAPFTPGASV